VSEQYNADVNFSSLSKSVSVLNPGLWAMIKNASITSGKEFTVTACEGMESQQSQALVIAQRPCNGVDICRVGDSAVCCTGMGSPFGRSFPVLFVG
jgi:hypothetical protein